MLRLVTLLALVTLTGFSLSAQKADLFILSVGVEQYRDSRLNLNYCADDARDLAAAIGRQNLLYTIHTPRVLTDAQASRAAIRTALSELEREVTTDDLLIFIFSGHGIEERLVTYDFNVADKTASSLGKDDLFELINKLGCGYLLFIDACHSGSFAKSGPKNITEAAAGLHSRALVEALAGTDKPYLIFGSSGSDQKSWECQSCGHGYFAQTVLDALQNKTVTSGARSFTPDGNGDGFISVYELDNYIKEAVRVQTAREESPQKVYSRLTMGANFPLFSLPGARLNPSPTPPVSSSGTQSSGTSAQTTPPPSPGADERRRDLEAYNAAKAAGTIEAYQEYLRVRPSGIFAESARKALNDLLAAQAAQRSAEEDDLDWTIAQTADTETAYRHYLDTWSNGRHRQEAQTALTTLNAPATLTDPLAGTFILVKGGTFTMGCTSEQSGCYDDERPTHSVTLSTYYMGQTEVTQAQWRAVMGTNPSSFKNCDDCPVESVSWNDVQDFITKLNSRSGGRRYRLPTEAEWEYAARGGSMSRGYQYAGSNNIDDVAWYTGNSGSKTRPVKGKKSNELSLYDMSGNVREWCEDDWHGNYVGAPTDGRAWVDSPRGDSRVNRGGSWFGSARACRVSGRDRSPPDYRFNFLGFRLVASPSR